jgi:hypothetical protein
MKIFYKLKIELIILYFCLLFILLSKKNLSCFKTIVVLLIIFMCTIGWPLCIIQVFIIINKSGKNILFSSSWAFELVKEDEVISLVYNLHKMNYVFKCFQNISCINIVKFMFSHIMLLEIYEFKWNKNLI